jgi:gas vesicle protein
MYGAETYTTEGTYERGNEFLIGLLCGTAVGAAVGLLLAPKPGAELRTQLADSAQRFRRRAEDTYEQASGAVNDMMEKGKKAVRRGKDKFDEARADYDANTGGTTTGTTSMGTQY